MKVRLTIDLNIPDSFASFTNAELRMAFWEEYIRRVHQAHLEDVMLYVNVMQDAPDEHAVAVITAAKEDALVWAKITDVPEWTMERVE